MSSSGFKLKRFNLASSENLKISENSHHIEIGQLYELWKNRTAAIAAGNYPEEAEIISKKKVWLYLGATPQDLHKRCKRAPLLSSGVRDYGRVIHGHVESFSEWLDKSMEAKLGGLYGSVLVSGNQPRPAVYRPAFFGPCSPDPGAATSRNAAGEPTAPSLQTLPHLAIFVL
ncbi:hypothetical protein Tco_1503029 [Tanacetum coccineum]